MNKVKRVCQVMKALTAKSVLKVRLGHKANRAQLGQWARWGRGDLLGRRDLRAR